MNRVPEFTYELMDMLGQNRLRNSIVPLWLGGSSGSGGGVGTPPGGIIGKLGQAYVAYDTDEAAATSGSTSLWDNMNHIRARLSTVIPMWNRSGGSLPMGAVVILHASNDESVTTTTTLRDPQVIGVLRQDISNGSRGLIVIGGYAPRVNTSGSAAIRQFLYAYTTAGLAVAATSGSDGGAFARVTSSGTNPSAIIFLDNRFTAGGGGGGGGVSLYTSPPEDVGNAAVTGVATTASPGDHVHRGVHLIHASGSAPLYGDVTLEAGANVTLTQAGQVITIAGSGGSAQMYTSPPADVGSSPLAGSSGSAAKGDHVHRGIRSVATGGSVPIYGDAVLVPGSGIGLSQSSGSITITATAGIPAWSGADRTASRQLNTVYTNGSYPRIVAVSMQLTGNVTYDADAILYSDSSGSPSTAMSAVRFNRGLAAGMRSVLVGLVQPSEKYWVRDTSGSSSSGSGVVYPALWWEYDATGGGGGGGGVTDAKYVVTAQHASLTAEKYRPELANYNPDIPPTSPSSYDDEFDDSSIAGKWTLESYDASFNIKQSSGSRHLSESTRVGLMLIQGVWTQFTGFYESFTPTFANAFTLAFKIYTAPQNVDDSFIGVGVRGQDDPHTYEARCGWSTQQSVRTVYVDGGGATEGVNALFNFGGGPIYLLIMKDTGTNFSVFASGNGLEWMPVELNRGITGMTSLTRLYFWIYNAPGRKTDPISAIDFIRYFATEGVFDIGAAP